ncbi:MAG: aryl-sulfate sulfotransferase [Bacilli bacterium]
MKKKIIGLILLILIIVGGLYLILNKREQVELIADILDTQYELEETYLKDLEDNGYTFNKPKVILNPYEISPLTALIMFETETEEEVEIIVVGKDEKTTIKNIFDKESKHIIPVYGLYPDSENKVIIKMNDQEKELIIKTDPLPENFVISTNVYADKEKVSDDLIFVSIALSGYSTAYDINGDVRWYLIGNYSWDIGRFENGNLVLSSSRPIAPPYYAVGLVEMDLTGKIYHEYVLPGGYHHDYYEMENGDLLISSDNFPNGTVEDYIVLMDRESGTIKDKWDLTEILPQEEGKSAMWDEIDWFHNNAVWYDKINNSIVLSGRHQDAVISIDYETKELNWIIGDPTNWSEEMQKYFFTPETEDFDWQWAQHAAMVLPNGNIFIFDNGNNRSKIASNYLNPNDNYSRGVIYQIDTEEMKIKQVWQYGKERGSGFFSPYISDVDYYNEGHYLVHSGGIANKDGNALNVPAPMVEGALSNSITVELLDDEKILELELPSNFYRAEKMPLYNDSKFSFGQGTRIGSLGVTEGINEKDNLLFADKNIPKEYNVKFSKEADRLVFKAKMLEGTKVRIILDNLFDRKTYPLTASSKAYTAMCIDIFNEDDNLDPQEVNLSAYINEEGLRGKYNLYLKINDKIYNLNQFVIFE